MKKVLLALILVWTVVQCGAEEILIRRQIGGDTLWQEKVLLHSRCDMASLSIRFISKNKRGVESDRRVQAPEIVAAVQGQIQSQRRGVVAVTGHRKGILGVYKLLDLYCREPQDFDAVEIEYSLSESDPKLSKYRHYHYDQIAEQVVNPDLFATYTMRFSRFNRAQTLAILIPEKVRSTLDSLNAYVAFKQSLGYEVLLVTDDQWGGGVGDTAAENIKKWILDNYESKGLDYLLFIGYPHTEKGEVPMKMTWPQFQLEKYREAPTDFYYAELSGNWDVDGDGNYGEFEDDFMQEGGPDHYAELNIGRIPVFSKTKTDHILNKLISYESEKSADANWRKNALLPMNNMNDVSDANFTPGIRLAERIKYDILEPASFSSFRIFDDNYEGFDLKTPAELTPCTYATVKETWNSQDFGLVVWQAHGFAQHATDVMSVPFSKVLNDDRVPFVFSTSCHNGSTNTDNLSHYLLQNGAINVVSATRVEYWSPGQDNNWDTWPTGGSMAYAYTKNMVTDSMSSAIALNRVKADIQTEMLELNSMWWMNWLVYNVYGDPTQGIYSTIDKDIEVKNPPVFATLPEVKLTKEQTSVEFTMATYVADEDNGYDELTFDVTSSDHFTITHGDTWTIAVNSSDSTVVDSVEVTVTDPDGLCDKATLVLSYDKGTSLLLAKELTGNGPLIPVKNPLSADDALSFVVLDSALESLDITLYDATAATLAHQQFLSPQQGELLTLKQRVKGGATLCLLFTCRYDKKSLYYKTVLGIKK